MSVFQIKASYNFNTLAPAILGTSFKRAVVLGIIDYDLASNYFNPETQHVNIYPYLPVGTLNDPKAYTYILFKTESGIKTVLALEWIDQPSIEVVTTQGLQINIPEVAEGDAKRIRDSLILLGFNSFTLKSI